MRDDVERASYPHGVLNMGQLIEVWASHCQMGEDLVDRSRKLCDKVTVLSKQLDESKRRIAEMEQQLCANGNGPLGPGGISKIHPTNPEQPMVPHSTPQPVLVPDHPAPDLPGAPPKTPTLVLPR